jgi:hypothetical protein
MRMIAALACLLGLLGAIPARAAASTDVFGREVPVGKGRPTLMLYANRGTSEQLRAHAFDFAYELREERPIVVVQVDLRDVPSLFRGTAHKEIRQRHRESLDFMKQLFHEQGQEPPADLEESLFMVADNKGETHRALGLPKGFNRVFAKALSPSGEELASGPFPDAAGELERAIESAPPAPLASAE